MLNADLGLRLGELDLEVELRVDDGEVVALLGPNGAGKTTAVRCIAGLQPVGRGSVVLDGVVLDDPAAGVLVPAEQRSIGVVFQDHLLFPRMSALENVAFGLRARGVAKAEARSRAGEWLARLDLPDAVGSLHPAALSGGQAQRVALARALAIEPQLLLLDEPLAALDASARMHVRSELRQHLASFRGARLLVTHDPVDALVLADRLVILEEGRVTQRGSPAEVTARPASRYVADLVGINLLVGTAEGQHSVRLAGGAELTVGGAVPPGDVAVAVRPQAVVLHRQQPEGSARNTWPATVADLEGDADRMRVRLDGPVPLVAEITAMSATDMGVAPGVELWASVKAVDLEVYER